MKKEGKIGRKKVREVARRRLVYSFNYPGKL